ncbi:MAG: ShlB/FhaC/HecB family hemolysin secretion/activation protein, partial [Cupriavidus sp.]|nr:ShlB/FhaC/HecB family hemolysin secretion/activation protein [Cupriavidus sp.]
MFFKPSYIATAASLALCISGYPPSSTAQTSPLAPRQSAALPNAEQDQRTRQQQEARERAAIVDAPAVRAEATARAEFPTLPKEAPCFRIDRFVLEVPKELPADLQTAGASALPMDPFSFAQLWLDHYQGECIGKQGVEALVKGVSQTILSKGYVTTRVLVPEQDLSSGTLKLA